MKDEFQELIKKYRTSPEFLFVELNDPNQKGLTGDTLLHAAAIRGSLEDVEVLIVAGAYIDAIGDLGNTALHHAASRGNAAIIRKLLQFGADLSIKNDFGQTALDLAELMNRNESIKFLAKQL